MNKDDEKYRKQSEHLEHLFTLKMRKQNINLSLLHVRKTTETNMVSMKLPQLATSTNKYLQR